MRTGLTISRYLLGAVLPYFLFAWLLLSVVLFVQQAGRFSDIFFSASIPSILIWQLSIALIPSVIAFTCPMAVLVGVLIGLAKLQTDSELVAMRAAGVGNAGIALPIVLGGVVLSVFAFLINLEGVPAAASLVRSVALRTALYKLESPIEPGVFNTEVAGFTIYVRDGDIEQGTWKDIFIYNTDPNSGAVRLITSSRGRIDHSGQRSELVLEDATASTFTTTSGGAEKYFSERVGEVRYAVKTKRDELVAKLNTVQLTPEELGLGGLAEYAKKAEGEDRREAEILWWRRIVLSVSPLLFALFGCSLVLRFNRKGRGFAIVSALASLMIFYLLAFLGEQLARTGRIPVAASGLFPIVFSLAAALWFSFTARSPAVAASIERVKDVFRDIKLPSRSASTRNIFVDLTTGLRDLDLITDVLKYFFLSLGFLMIVFLVFTAFELWKFAGTKEGGVAILIKYLGYLIPFVYLQLAPSAAMVATLATYVIKARQNELVTWISAGQSLYRLLAPCLAVMAVLGFLNWEIQERIAPRTNQIQDELRTELRSRDAIPNRSGLLWVATADRIYSFKPADNASDNAIAPAPCNSGSCRAGELSVFEFKSDRGGLQAVYHADSAEWRNGRVELGPIAEKILLSPQGSEREFSNFIAIPERSNPFAEIRKKASHLTAAEAARQLENSESVAERRAFAVAVQRKYTTPFLPIIIALISAPFALRLGRSGKVATVGYAVGLWLIFMATTAIFEQMGLNGSLSPPAAIWAPVLIFLSLGVLMLSRAKT